MAFKLIWSASAQLDVKDIAFFISEDSPSAARRFIQSLFLAVERLADFPESGRVVPEFDDPAIREVIRRPCRIVYRINRYRAHSRDSKSLALGQRNAVFSIVGRDCRKQTKKRGHSTFLPRFVGVRVNSRPMRSGRHGSMEGVRSCFLPSPFLAGQSCSPHNSGVRYALQFPFGINHALDEPW